MLALAFACFSFASVGTEEPFSELTFDAARTAAEKQSKVVLIDFFTTWCAPCRKLDETTWKNEYVRAWLRENAVAIKIDAEREPALAARFGIEAYPTIVLVRPDGSELGRMVGYRAPELFLAEAPLALAGKLPRLTEEHDDDEDGDGAANARMDAARKLVRQGEHAKALKEYLWCWDHGRNSRGFGGVRGSFLLADIVDLGQKYPAALEALRTRRDVLEAAVRAGNVDWEQVSDLSSLNEHLEGETRTLALYDELVAKGTEQRTCLLLRDELTDAFLANRRYQDIVHDPGAMVERVLEQFRVNQELFKDEPSAMRDSLKDFDVRQAVKSYEALLGVEDLSTAAKIAEAVIARDPSVEAYRRLIHHATRAGAAGVAETLRRRAAQSLTEQEAKLLEPAPSAPRDPQRALMLLEKAIAAEINGPPFSADVEATFATGGVALKARGSVLIAGPLRGRERITLDGPAGSIETLTVADGENVWIHQKGGPEGEVVMQGTVRELLELAPFSMDQVPQDPASQLKQVLKYVDLEGVEETNSGDVPCVAVTATLRTDAPVPKGTSEFVARMRLLLDRETSAVIGFEMFDGTGARTSSTTYRNVVRNPPIPADAFTFRIPDGVTVKKLSDG
jgi:outer membrane lipoprotein-sorting protein/thiol-disulfide isomerase/thioredoxin